MTKACPFPWTYDAHGYILAKDNTAVAYLSAGLNDGATDKRIGPLLAAAGDLEAALRELVAAIDAESGLASRLEPELTGARAALARAKPQAPVTERP